MALLPPLLARDGVGINTNFTYPDPAPPTFLVICAYPLSGQYGPGTRYLYYGLVAVCIFARRHEWLREPCLAAALLFPALASIHAIIMACYSDSELVDLDIYGVLVVIAVATLAMPLTLRFSRTYFNTPGRNLVFLCALLNLAGLISLSVAFFRIKTHTCVDGNNQPIHDDSGGALQCQFNCAIFPDTPIRAGSNSGMQLGFAPRTGVTLNTGIILSITFCLFAFLSIVTMWNQVILDNARKLGFLRDATSILPRRQGEGEKPIGGVKGLLDWISHRPDNFSSELVKLGLHLIEMLVYSGAMLATIIISEVTFWSVELRAGVEPMTSVGQWSPIAGALITSLGALYCALDTEETPAARIRAEKSNAKQADELVTSPIEDNDAPESRFIRLPTPPEAATQDIAGRRRVADLIRRAGTLLDPDPERYNNRVYLQGRYRTYPRTPGEDLLNPKLPEHEKKFYEARRAGHSRSQISLILPSSPNGRDTHACASTSGSGEQTPAGGYSTPTPRDIMGHNRTGSSGSQFLEVPRPFPVFSAVVTNTEATPQQSPSSLPSDNDPPRITFT